MHEWALTTPFCSSAALLCMSSFAKAVFSIFHSHVYKFFIYLFLIIFNTDFAIIHLWCRSSDWPGRNVSYCKWVVVPLQIREIQQCHGRQSPSASRCPSVCPSVDKCLDFYSVDSFDWSDTHTKGRLLSILWRYSLVFLGAVFVSVA